MTKLTDAAGGELSIGYDANGNVTSVTDALQHTTSFSPDIFDRVARRTDPVAHTDSFEYDGNGNLTRHADRKGQETTVSYDALDRPSVVTFHDGSTISYSFDAADRATAIVDSVNGTITRQYDDLDRLTSETTPEGTIAYTYDVDGLRATMTVAGQPTVSYTYDAAHQPVNVVQGASQVTATYDPAGRRSSLSYPNGIVSSYGYDAAGQLTRLDYSLNGTVLGDLTYSYNGAGRPYGAAGSWARTALPEAATASYDAANRMESWNGSPLIHDRDGNLIDDGLNVYSWNARNQLTALGGRTAATFAYDGLGRRRFRNVDGTSTRFLYDGVNVVQEQNGAGGPTASVLTGLAVDEAFVRNDSSGTASILSDGLNSTVALTDAEGSVTTQYTFTPFGDTQETGRTSPNSRQFAGRENDGTGLYFYRARYYSPTWQRFISEDPLGAAGGINRFGYAANRPTQLSDPFGLKPAEAFGSNVNGQGQAADGSANAAANGEDVEPVHCSATAEGWFRPADHPYVVGRGARRSGRV